jgi:hypothetical protein
MPRPLTFHFLIILCAGLYKSQLISKKLLVSSNQQKKTNEMFVRISALASKKRSN